MEMKEIYPKLPTAPPIENQGQGYRLQKINEIQAFLKKEVATREALSKKYSRAAKIVDNVDTVLITITSSKAKKHEKIKTIASTKLDTISSHISKALSDNKVTDEEFWLILEELEKYKVMKEEVRAKTKKKIATELEKHSSRKGGKKHGSPFVSWLKRTIRGVRFETPKYNCSFSCVVTND